MVLRSGFFSPPFAEPAISLMKPGDVLIAISASRELTPQEISNNNQLDYSPDVYYIILDMYARPVPFNTAMSNFIGSLGLAGLP